MKKKLTLDEYIRKHAGTTIVPDVVLPSWKTAAQNRQFQMSRETLARINNSIASNGSRND